MRTSKKLITVLFVLMLLLATALVASVTGSAESNVIWQADINASLAQALSGWGTESWGITRAGDGLQAPVFSYADNALVVSERGENWHGFDVLLEPLNLSDNQKYRITVNGNATGTDILRLEFPADGIAGTAWGFGTTYGTASFVSMDFDTTIPEGIVLDEWCGFRVRVYTNGMADYSISSIVITRLDNDQPIATTPPRSPAWDIIDKMGMGINIGNLFEAREWGQLHYQHSAEQWEWFLKEGYRTQERLWGQPPIEQWHFKAIALKGFNTVRIPVTWETQLDENGVIHPEWMAKVRQAVQWAYDEGLYVIINTHHERSQHNSLKVIIDRDGTEAAKLWLENIWEQIIDEFGDFGHRLIFEPMNEPYHASGEGTHWIQPNAPLSAWQELSDKVNELNHFMVDFIRNSNDPLAATRVIVTTLPQADPCALPLYIHPNDDNVILGTFFYPQHRISDIEAAVNRGVPLLIKETAPASDPDNFILMPDWETWIADTHTAFKNMGLSSLWWNISPTVNVFTDTTLYDRGTNTWDNTLTNSFFAAYNREPGLDFTNIPPPNLPHNLTGGFADGGDMFTFWIPPARELATAEKMVVEYNTPFTGGFAFARFTSEWQMFEQNDPRISHEQNKIIFDLRGLEGNQLGFAAWDFGHPAQLENISRVYIDKWRSPAWDIIDNMGMGINIGGLFDAREWGPLHYEYDAELWEWFLAEGYMVQERTWRQPQIEQWHFKAIALKGFNTVRIPVTWETQLDENGAIRPEWMAKVRQAVQWAYDEGFYVILNTHNERSQHDSLKVIIDRDGVEAAKPWLENIWGQIIDEFGDFGHRLIFEPMNEPYHAAREHFLWITPNAPLSAWQELSDKTNELNHFMVDFIRNSNDPLAATRVIVTTLPQADPGALPLYIHPNDDNVILGTFFYSGHCISDIEAAVNRGVPLFIKETSPADITTNFITLIPNWNTWADSTYNALANLGVSALWWNISNTDALLFERSTGEWNNTLVNYFFSPFGIELGHDFTDIPPPKLPVDLIKGFPDEIATFTYWIPPPREFAFAERVVLEYISPFTGGFAFARFGGDVEWQMFNQNDPRISHEQNKIIFDLRGLEGNMIGFAAWDFGHPAQLENISRIYLDKRDDTDIITQLQDRINEAQYLLDNTEVSTLNGADIPSNIYWTTPEERAALSITLSAARTILSAYASQ